MAFSPPTTGSHNSRDRETLTLRRDETSVTIVMHAKKSFWIDANKPTKFVCVAVCCTKHSHSSLVFRVLFFRLHKASRSEEKKLCKWPACRWSFFSKKFTKIVLTKMLTLETSLGALIVKLIRTGSIEVDKRRDGLKWSALSINNRTLELERNTKLVYEKFRWGSKSCAHSRTTPTASAASIQVHATQMNWPINLECGTSADFGCR